jgi:hypothetical protein
MGRSEMGVLKITEASYDIALNKGRTKHGGGDRNCLPTGKEDREGA